METSQSGCFRRICTTPQLRLRGFRHFQYFVINLAGILDRTLYLVLKFNLQIVYKRYAFL